MSAPDARSAPAHALSDGEDRLVEADELIARLQYRCGGQLPGTIAVPALLETVRKARRYELKLARSITAQGGSETVSAWVEVAPREDGEPGCVIALHNWQSEGKATVTAAAAPGERFSPTVPAMPVQANQIERDLAELVARLDGNQCLLSVESDAIDLGEALGMLRAAQGQRWTDILAPAGIERRQSLHWRLLDGARLEVPGSAREWRVRLLPFNDPGGDLRGFELLLVSDEPPPLPAPIPQAVRDAQRDSADHAQRVVGREIAPVLRQPIARIIANAETIRAKLAGPLAEEYSNYAADIAAAGQHLLGLLDDLSDLEVVEAAEFSTAPDRIDLADVARRAAGILGVRAREHEIIIDAPKVGESLPAVAEFRRVLQVLLNLLGNAIRYAPGNSQVWVRLEDAGSRARVIVADQGPGLNEDQQRMIFAKFERLGRSGDGGSGLGLYISRRLARAMGGDLTVESAPGQGARFILDLPADLLAPRGLVS